VQAVLISAGFGWFRLVYVRGKKLKEVERSEASGVNVKPATSPWATRCCAKFHSSFPKAITFLSK